jgi:acetyl esterase/lipase
MDRAVVRKDVIYRTTDAGPLTMDLRAPADADAPLPAVVLVLGYNDVGFEKVFGSRFKETAMVVSWAELIAASGMTAITYTNREPAADLESVLQHIHNHAAELGVDGERIGIWATSGNVPVALSALMRSSDPGGLSEAPRTSPPAPRAGVLLYGFMLDLDGATGVAESAASFRFANPNSGRSLQDLPAELPLLIVRAGLEQFPHLNESIDRFVASAVAANRPITLVNHATGAHAFDLIDESAASRAIVRQVLAFLRDRLS